jgi:hypothetical protein
MSALGYKALMIVAVFGVSWNGGAYAGDETPEAAENLSLVANERTEALGGMEHWPREMAGSRDALRDDSGRLVGRNGDAGPIIKTLNVRGERKPDVPMVIDAAYEREQRIQSQSLADIGRDPVVRSIIAKQYGPDALRIADANPRLFGMFNGEYSAETVEVALGLVGDPKSMASRIQAKGPWRGGTDMGATISQQILDYAPVYSFHFRHKCYPIRWNPADVDRCESNVPASVPVYASVSFRPSDQGGGAFSYWINYHVFYGHQTGWIAGAHGDDWEASSVHFVNNAPVSVKYRVHGSAVTIYPWNWTEREGNRHKVYVGAYFHGHNPNSYCRFGGGNILGEYYKTWWDCRGGDHVRGPEVLPCNFESISNNGDSCSRFSRNLWEEPRQSRKSEPSPVSGIPTPNWNVPANLPIQWPQICYTSEAGYQGIGDCTDANVPWIGHTMNDIISTVRYYGLGQDYQLWEHGTYRGHSTTPAAFGRGMNDKVSSISRR